MADKKIDPIEKAIIVSNLKKKFAEHTAQNIRSVIMNKVNELKNRRDN